METHLPDGRVGGFIGQFEGDMVSPDSVRLTGTFIFPDDLGDATRFEVIAIGDRAWKRIDTPTWVQTDRSDLAVETALNLTPVDALQTSTAQVAYMVAPWPATPDVVEGVRTLRYALPSDLREEAIAKGNADLFERLLGGGEFADAESLEFSVWLAEDDQSLIQVHMAYSSRPDYLGNMFREDVPPGTQVYQDATVTFTRHNDPAIVIEPPP